MRSLVLEACREVIGISGMLSTLGEANFVVEMFCM